MLIELNDIIVNTDQIREIVYVYPLGKADGQTRARLTWVDGTSSTYIDNRNSLRHAFGSVVPAPSGFWHASVQGSEDGAPWFCVLPVVAFRIDGLDEFSCKPLTPDGDAVEGGVLVFPDGRCRGWDGPFYATLDEWKAAIVAGWKP